MVGLSYKNQPVTGKLEHVMSNYVIPSIRSLDEMDHYSESIQWDNFTYRIPKGLKLIAQKSLKDSAEMRDYRGSGIRLIVAKKPVKVDDKYIYSFIDEISEIKPESQIIGDVPVSYTHLAQIDKPDFEAVIQENKGKFSTIDEYKEYFNAHMMYLYR